MEFYSNVAKIMAKYWKVFLVKGVGYTLILTTITVFFGAILGVFICLARMSKSKVLNAISLNLTEIIRGTPMLLQLYVFYFGLPRLFPSIPTFVSVLIGFTINSACYVSEVFRSGIQAVDNGQTEAARSLGLNGRQTMMKIVLPQAALRFLPQLASQFVGLVKETSVAYVIGVNECHSGNDIHTTLSEQINAYKEPEGPALKYAYCLRKAVYKICLNRRLWMLPGSGKRNH